MMAIFLTRVIPLLVLLGAGPATAQIPLLDPAASAGLSERCAASFRKFLLGNLNRAFAVGESGDRCGYWVGAGAGETAAAKALDLCGGAARACRIFAQDLDLADRPAPPRPLLRPSLGDGWTLRADPAFFQLGPASARGAILFAHGRRAGVDGGGTRIPALVRPFNNAGWDVWRYDRANDRDQNYAWALDHHRDAIAELRARAYHRIILVGHSRGGWQTLDLLAAPGPVDGMIAIAPARHGARGNPRATVDTRQMPEFAEMLARAVPSSVRVALITLADDPYDADPVARGEMFEQILGAKGLAVLAVPAPQGFSGHGGASDFRFTEQIAPCLYRFLTGTRPGGVRCRAE